MTAPRPWTVLPHDPVQTLEDNLRVVRGTLPRGHMHRRMTVARLSDGGLVFHNAIPLEETAMAAFESWGTPQILLVTNRFHRLDVHAFKVRYPNIRVLCPHVSQKEILDKIPIDGFFENFPKDASVELIPLRGSKLGEATLSIKSDDRVSLCFADTVMNIRSMPGLDGLLFRLLGSVGKAKVTPLTRMVGISNRKRLKGHLSELSHLPGLHRLIPTHGDIVEGNAVEVLKAVAEAL